MNMENKIIIKMNEIVEEETMFYPGSFFSCDVYPVRPAELERNKRIAIRLHIFINPALTLV
jgi:hypothetical protein